MNLISVYTVQSYETVNQALRKNQSKKLSEVEANYEELDNQRKALNANHLLLLQTTESLIRNVQALESTLLNYNQAPGIVFAGYSYLLLED